MTTSTQHNPATARDGAVKIPDQGITDAEMWRSVDDYECQLKALKLLKEAAPSIFLTNRARLAVVNIFAPFVYAAALSHESRDTAVEPLEVQAAEPYCGCKCTEAEHKDRTCTHRCVPYHFSKPKPAEVQADVCENCPHPKASHNKHGCMTPIALDHECDCPAFKPARKELADLDRENEVFVSAWAFFVNRYGEPATDGQRDHAQSYVKEMADFALQMLRDHGRDERERVAKELRERVEAMVKPRHVGGALALTVASVVKIIDKLLSEGTSK